MDILDLPNGFEEDRFMYGARCPKCGSYVNASNFSNEEYFCVHCGNIFDWGDEDVDKIDEEDIPDCCAACGGPYPDCMTSCNMFDD